MSDVILFRITNGATAELPGAAYSLKKPLQTLIEQNLESLLVIHFLASEYSTDKTHAGRIDIPYIFEEGKLDENSVTQDSQSTAADGKNIARSSTTAMPSSRSANA